MVAVAAAWKRRRTQSYSFKVCKACRNGMRWEKEPLAGAQAGTMI